MEVSLTLPVHKSNQNVEKAPTSSVDTLVVQTSIFATTPEGHEPAPEAQLQATSQSAAVNVDEAIEELKLSIPGVDPNRIFYRKAHVPMRLNKEAGKGEPPFVVMNDDITYFGYELLPLESTKFGSTLRASRMVEPEYLAALLEPSLPAVAPLPTVENCEDESLDAMMQFVDLSRCLEIPVAVGPMVHGSETSTD